MPRAFLLACVLALAACASLPPAATPDVLLLGEQHDADAHPRLHQRAVEELVATGRLAALALEMADAGRTTAGLPAQATQPQVREALAWDERAWPWARYAGPVMAAVRAGAPVAGANVSRLRLREAAADASLDAGVGPDVMRAQVDAVREGHCGLLPAAQLAPMARMQVARDRAMAQSVAALAKPGQTVVVITGARHADPKTGVAVHLPASLRFESRIWPAEPARDDHCARLRQQWAPK